MAVVGMVHSIHEVWSPAGIRFDADNFQLGMALEDTAEDKGADNVLVAANNRHERVNLRTARWFGHTFARSQNMEAKRHLHLNRRLPELVVNRAVVIFHHWET